VSSWAKIRRALRGDETAMTPAQFEATLFAVGSIFVILVLL
jgi:hypothetical protein